MASSGRIACLEIRLSTQNTSIVADPGFCNTHVRTLNKGTVLRKSPTDPLQNRPGARVLQNQVTGVCSSE